MTELEITKLCAEAMGIFITDDIGQPMLHNQYYKPIHDDAQAMALVKMFRLNIDHHEQHGGCAVWITGESCHTERAHGRDLNRAICECVAKMSKDK